MNLPEVVKKISKSVVAISLQTFHPKDESIGIRYNPFIGTGFVVDEDGIVLTCGHVVDEIIKAQDLNLLTEIKDFKDSPKKEPRTFNVKCPAQVIFFIDDGKTTLIFPVSIMSLYKIIDIKTSWERINNYIPDIGVLEIKATGLEKIEIVEDYRNIYLGEEVATIGFPMGNNLLLGKKKNDAKTDEYIKQASPVVQNGLISAILPARCRKPESILTNIMIQGGASGSPLFLTADGKAVGLINYSIYQYEPRITKEHSLPTNFSYAVSLHFIRNKIWDYKDKKIKEKKDIKDIIKESKEDSRFPTFQII